LRARESGATIYFHCVNMYSGLYGSNSSINYTFCVFVAKVTYSIMKSNGLVTNTNGQWTVCLHYMGIECLHKINLLG